MLKDRRQVNALPIIDKVKSIVINCASVSILGHTPEWTTECKQCSGSIHTLLSIVKAST